MPSSASATSQLHALSLHDALPIYKIADRGLGPGSAERTVERNMPRRFENGLETHLVGDGEGAELDDISRRFATQGNFRCNRMGGIRSEEHTSELQSPMYLVCRLLLPRPASFTPFPYTTLFRSTRSRTAAWAPVPLSGQSSAICPAGSRMVLKRILSAMVKVLSSMTSRAGSPHKAISVATAWAASDRKSTRLNSSHRCISYAVFCFRDQPASRPFPTRRSSDLQDRGPRPGPRFR